MACEVVGSRITAEVEGARDGRACAWRSGPRAQASGEPWGDIPEVCGATRAGAWDDVRGAFEGWTKQWWWQPAVEGRQCRRVGLLHAHGTSTMCTRSRHDMHTCAYYVDGRPGAMPVSSTCAQGARDELLRLVGKRSRVSGLPVRLRLYGRKRRLAVRRPGLGRAGGAKKRPKTS